MMLSKRHFQEVINRGKEEYIVRLAKFLKIETEDKSALDLSTEILGQLNWGMGTRMLELLGQNIKEEKKE